MAKDISQNDNRRKDMMRRNIFRVQRAATLLFLVVATVVAIAMGSFKAISCGSKIVWTQLQLAHCYTEIQNLESDRDKNLDWAQEGYYGASNYVAAAEQDDARITELNQRRSDLCNSDDPVVAWAAKNGFDFVQSVIGLLLCLAPLALLVVVILLRTKVFRIFDIELMIFDSIMSGFFYALRFVLVRLVRFSSAEFQFHNYQRKRALEEHRKNVQRKDDDTVVPFKRKQRKQRNQRKTG